MGREGKRKSKFVEGGETGEVGEKDTEREKEKVRTEIESKRVRVCCTINCFRFKKVKFLKC